MRKTEKQNSQYERGQTMERTRGLHLTYNNDVLNSVENEKVLGVRIDNNLTWSIHINFIAKKISSNLWLLSKLKDYLSTEHRVQFYKAYIQPHIDYCSTIWGGTSQYNLN